MDVEMQKKWEETADLNSKVMILMQDVEDIKNANKLKDESKAVVQKQEDFMIKTADWHEIKEILMVCKNIVPQNTPIAERLKSLPI